MNRYFNQKKDRQTICWDCANYNGGCSWSLEFKPVEGWSALPTVLRLRRGKGEPSHVIQSFCVIQCPEFLRDANKNGQEWARPDHRPVTTDGGDNRG